MVYKIPLWGGMRVNHSWPAVYIVKSTGDKVCQACSDDDPRMTLDLFMTSQSCVLIRNVEKSIFINGQKIYG